MKYIRTEKGVEKLTEAEYKKRFPEVKTYKELRQDAYGNLSEQLEFITENGLEAWQNKVAEIKAKYPKK